MMAHAKVGIQAYSNMLKNDPKWTIGTTILIAVWLIMAVSVMPVSGYTTGQLLLNFTFEDGSGSTVTDNTGYGNDGTLSNPSLWSTEEYNGTYSLVFNSAEWVNITDSGDLSFDATNGGTVTAWVNTNTTNAYQYVFDKTESNGNESYRLYLDNSGSSPVCAVRTSGGYVAAGAAESLGAGTWYHLACVYNVSHINTYINGTLVKQSATTGTININNDDLIIGSHDRGQAMNQEFIGNIDQVRLWNTALNDTEIVSEVQGSLAPENTDDVTAPAITLITPTNTNITTQTATYTEITFNCTATDAESILANSTLYGNWSGWHANETNSSISGTYNQSVFSKDLPEGDYLWNCYWCDNVSNCAFDGANYTFSIYDNVNPTYRSQGSNESTVDEGEALLLYTEGYDLIGLDTATLYTNESDEGVIEYPDSTWTKYPDNPVLVHTPTGIGVPDVIYVDGVYHMFHEDNEDTYHQMYYANSTDGVHWDEQGIIIPFGEEGTWNEVGTSNADLVQVNDTTWYMYLVGQYPFNVVGIGLAYTDTSRDNMWMNWTMYPYDASICSMNGTGDGCIFNGTESWELYNGNSFVTYPTVVKIGDAWHMLYAASNPTDNPYNHKVGYANSTDGIHWTKYESNPVLRGDDTGFDGEQILSPYIINISDDLYYVFYDGVNGTEHATGVVQTTNFINYTNRSATAIVSGGDSYDDNGGGFVAGACVYKNDTHWMMWYEAKNTTYSIALATTPLYGDNEFIARETIDTSDAADTWTWTNFTWSNSSISSGSTIAWFITYNDTSGNTNTTSELSFDVTTASDSTPPQIQFNAPYATNQTLGENVTYIYWTASADEDLGTCYFDINGTNYTAGSVSGPNCYYNDTGLTGNVTRCAVVHANDTSDNWNTTDIMVCISTNEQQNVSTTGYITVNVYDETDLTHLYNYTLEFQQDVNPVLDYGINTTYGGSSVTGVAGWAVSAANIFDNSFTSYGRSSSSAGDNATGWGNIYLGGSDYACVKWGKGASGTADILMYAKYTNGSWVHLGSESNVASGEGETSCYAIDNTQFDDNIEVNITIHHDSNPTENTNIYEVFAMERYDQYQLNVSVSDLYTGSNRIAVDDNNQGGDLYYPRYYYITVANTTNTSLTAYLLPRSGITVVQSNFLAVDSFGSVLSDVSISIQKGIGGTWTTIAQGETDDSGLASFYLEENVNYRVMGTYSGNVVYQNVNAQAQTYTLTFNTSLDIGFNTTMDDIMLRILPETVSYNSTNPANVTFKFTIASNESELSTFGMMMYCNSSSLLYVSNTTGSPSGGSIEVSLNVTGCSNVSMIYYFTKNDGTDYNNTQTWYVSVSYPYGLARALELARTTYSTNFMIFIMIMCMLAVGVPVFIATHSTEGSGVLMLLVAAFFSLAGILEWYWFMLMGFGMFGYMFVKRRGL